MAMGSMMFGKGMGKGKGKDKGKNARPAPPAGDEYWTKKSTSENRIDGDGTIFMGKIVKYHARSGWGFLKPDETAALPDHVVVAMDAAVAEQQAKGKAIEDASLIYFRKPDLVEGF